jgi:effector-binding domain-containing protein
MNFFRIIIGLLCTTIIGILVAGLFIPHDHTSTTVTTINAKASDIFPHLIQIKKIKAWKNWMSDEVEIEAKDDLLHKGSIIKWKSIAPEGGIGIHLVTGLEQNKSIEFKTEIEKPKTSTSYSSFHLNKSGQSTEVRWDHHISIPYPFNVLAAFKDVDGALTKTKNEVDADFNSLKAIVEDEVREYNGYRVKPDQIEDQFYVIRRDLVSFEEISNFYGTEIPKLYKTLRVYNVKMLGMPCVLNFTWDKKNLETEMGVGMRVADSVIVVGYETLAIPASNIAIINYYGPYDELNKAHVGFSEYLNVKNLEYAMPTIEEFVTDPGVQPDTSKWLTRVKYLIQ